MEKSIVRFMVILGSIITFGLLTSCGGGGGSGGSTPQATLVYVDNANTVHALPTTVDLGGMTVNKPGYETITLQNRGNLNLTIGDLGQAGSPLSPGSPFSIYIDNCSNKTLPQWNTCQVTLQFIPTSQGISPSYTWSIPSNASNADAAKITLTGEGYGLDVWVDNAGTCSNSDVSVYVKVDDQYGDGLTNLLKENFTLFESGIQINEFTVTTNSQASPVSVVVALDESESVYDIRHSLELAADSFVDLLHDSDEAAIFKFNNSIDKYPAASPYFVAGDAAGKTALKAYIDTLYAYEPGTLLYDTVYQSIDRAAQGSKQNKAVIVLSDGFEANGTTPSTIKSLDQVIAYAKQKGIPVFTIYYTEDNFGNRAAMEQLADETGGKFYDSSTGTTLTEIFQQISTVFTNRYNLRYRSATSCTAAKTYGVKVDNIDKTLYGKDTKTVSFQ